MSMHGSENTERSSNPVTIEQELLEQQAYQSFLKGNFDACLVTLNILNNTEIFEASLSNNLALVDYERCDRSDMGKYLNALSKVMSTYGLDLNELSSFDVREHFTLLYNYSACMYYQGKRKELIEIMEILYANVEYASDMCLVNIFMMLSSLYIEVENYGEALNVLNKLERFIIYDENQVIFKPITAEDKENITEQKCSESEKFERDALKSNISYLRFICFMSVKNYREAKNQLRGIKSDPAINLLCTSCFEYFCGNTSQSLKLLTEWSKFSDEKNSETANLKKVILLNNTSCIYGALYQFDIGNTCCLKALDINNKILSRMDNKNDKKSDGIINYNSRIKSKILYNCGLHSLFSGNIITASKYFIEVVKSCNRSPLVWLRLAECCIYCFKRNNKSLFSLDLQLKHLGTHMISKSPIAFSDFIFEFDHNLSGTTAHSQSNISCLSFCIMALLNSLYCLGYNSNAPLENDSTCDVLTYKMDPCTPITSNTFLKLKSFIFTDLAFCYLMLENYIVSWHFASKVLQSSHYFANQKILCSLYCAECLTIFNEFDEAIDILTKSLANNRDRVKNFDSSDNSQNLPLALRKIFKKRGHDVFATENLFVDPMLVCGILSYALAIVHTMKHDVRKALEFMNVVDRVFGKYKPNPVFNFKLSLEYLKGNVNDILKILKENFSHEVYFV